MVDSRPKYPQDDAPIMSAATLTPYDAIHRFLVSEVMTDDVVVARPDDSLLSAGRIMRDRKVSGLPVVDAKDHLVGVISERDVLREIHRAGGVASPRGILDLIVAPGAARERLVDQVDRHLAKISVGASMTSRVVTVEPDATLSEAIHLLLQYGVNRLPVTEGRRLVGVLAREDVLVAVGEALQPPPRPAAIPVLRTARPRPARKRRLEDLR